MATYKADRVAATIPARFSEGMWWEMSEYTVVTALAVNDLLQLFTVQKGATLLDLLVSSDGTQGANNDSVFTVGDTGDTDRFITTAGGLILRTGGGIARMNAHAGMGYVYTAAGTIDLKLTTAGTGQTTGGVIRATALFSPGR